MGYLNYFGLREDPFRMTPDRNFYFATSGHTAVLEVVRYGLRTDEGFIIITGEVGTGKTLLLRMMMDELPAHLEIALILSPHLSRIEMLAAIIQDLGLPVLAEQQHSLDSLLRILNDHLYDLARKGKKLLIVVDEAQNLPDESLEQVRLLSNFETDTNKLLQIVLFGQPELLKKLAQPNMRQLVQRVCILENLPPLSERELDGYLQHHFQKSGGKATPYSFPALHLLWQATRGYPRLINKFMSRALLVAYAEKSREITRKILREAIDSFAPPKRSGITQLVSLPGGNNTLSFLRLLWGIWSPPRWFKDQRPGRTPVNPCFALLGTLLCRPKRQNSADINAKLSQQDP